MGTHSSGGLDDEMGFFYSRLSQCRGRKGSRETTRGCQGIVGAPAKLTQVTKDGTTMVLGGDDLLIQFYLIKLERSSQNVSV